MPDLISKLSDKNVLERKVAHADDKSRAAVKKVRAGLGKATASDKGMRKAFTVDMLRRHADLQLRACFAVLFLISIAGYLTHLALPFEFVVIWLALTTTAWCLIWWQARRFLAQDIETIDITRWSKRFIIFTTVMGCFWAVLFAFYPMQNSDGLFSVLSFTAAMVLTGLSQVTAKNLKYGVLASSLPIVLVVAIRLIEIGTVATIGMALILVAASLFFQSLADQMRVSHIEHLKSKAERDQLIMELEDARSISDEARRRAEEANLAKSRFLATMSHELRTPLNAILGFSELISSEVMGPLHNENYKEYINDIHSSGTHLLELINEILDLSRVEAGRYKLAEEATSLSAIAEDARQMVKLKAAEKDVALIMQIQPDLPQIWADARAVRQVVLNLLSNALKFTPTGGTIWLKCGWTAGGGQYVAIKDNGPGIAEEEIPIVLSSFGQGSIAIKSAEQGTGLGLPIVQALVHMHDGTFDLKSKLREGTEVIATFPRKRVMEVMPALPQDGAKVPAGKRTMRRLKQVSAPPMASQGEVKKREASS